MAIEIESLAKRYGRFEALAGVSLSVKSGGVFGLLGPNGAGKSTLVKSLLTLVRPSRCQGTLLGRPIGHRATLAKVGYLPEHARFPDYLTGRQIVRMSAGLSQMARKLALAREEMLLERVGMATRADDVYRHYSKGMRQRIGIAQALIHDPQLVFLDEPTDGVDPQGRVEIRRMIEEMKAEGRTVFVNSHLLDEVEQVADEVAILCGGRMVERGRTADLTRREVSFVVRSQGPLPFELKAAFEKEGWLVGADSIEVRGEAAEVVQPVIDALRARNVSIREIRESRRSLEQVFLEAVNRKEEA
ncbi:ABC-2 type transport system ATP-binding protein [Haloferula luteola]|uniref:ABC-2 type transport system ATP-binding protein n=1 Tax=Haloferula luteola TaxID=595692 RepID=A0A840V5X9_9BACT|nr:ABC transporter ATP-binding protein [Haloferula luteola]MBB5352436.1 ABC-2 type transport system ATP-binding protein [Haloferula luteola]